MILRRELRRAVKFRDHVTLVLGGPLAATGRADGEPLLDRGPGKTTRELAGQVSELDEAHGAGYPMGEEGADERSGEGGGVAGVEEIGEDAGDEDVDERERNEEEGESADQRHKEAEKDTRNGGKQRGGGSEVTGARPDSIAHERNQQEKQRGGTVVPVKVTEKTPGADAEKIAEVQFAP